MIETKTEMKDTHATSTIIKKPKGVMAPPNWPFPTYKGEPTTISQELASRSRRDFQMETISKADDALF